MAEYLWAYAVTQDGLAITPKHHCFERPDLKSLCQRYDHDEYFQTEADPKHIGTKHTCKKCYEKWLRGRKP